MFSGGAAFGKFHYGVIKSLVEQDLMPKVICGSSAGSMVAAGLSTLKFDELDIVADHEVCFGKRIVSWTADNKINFLAKMVSGKPLLDIDTMKIFIRDVT